MFRFPAAIALFVSTTLAFAGCITGGNDMFSDADARIGRAVSGTHDDRLCIPPPATHGDDVTVKLYLEFDGDGEIRMTGRDGPELVQEVAGHTSVRENPWYRGWNTGEICVDVMLDGRGDYAIGAYLEKKA